MTAVPAAMFIAVLPRGSGGHRTSPPAPAGGWGHSGRIGVRSPETSGVVPGNRGGRVWPLEVPVRGAVAHRLRPVGISAQARSVTAGAGLAFRVSGTLIGRPSPNQHPPCGVYQPVAECLSGCPRRPRIDPRSRPGRGRFALVAMLGRRPAVTSPGHADSQDSYRV